MTLFEEYQKGLSLSKSFDPLLFFRHPLVMASKIIITCSWCNSPNVSRDAWADWDVASQTWILGAVYDQGFCHNCETEQSLLEVPFDESADAEVT